MPLRDHFHRSPRKRNPWGALHAAWPTFMVVELNAKLSDRYVAEPRVYLGSTFEVDLGTLDRDGNARSLSDDPGGGVAVATLAPPQPTLAVATDLPDMDEYEVLIHDMDDGRLVAAVEIVSPANKDRPR